MIICKFNTYFSKNSKIAKWPFQTAFFNKCIQGDRHLIYAGLTITKTFKREKEKEKQLPPPIKYRKYITSSEDKIKINVHKSDSVS